MTRIRNANERPLRPRRRRHRPRDLESASDPATMAITREEWERANHYDRATRTYEDEK